ncbi:MAG: PAS domain S-box protein, partial [Anaerolineales bacterium]|nr:PAS domain S-box protein [Anaerolineales bacterium]
ISAIIILLTGQSSWLMLRRTAPPLRAITRDVGIVFLLYALAAFARIIELGLMPLPATSGFFESPPIQMIFILINQMLCIVLTFTLILMVTRRLELDVQTQSVERTRAEQVLAESQKRFALAFRSSPYAITITRASDGKIVDVNEGFTQIAGYSAAECIGKTTVELNLWVDEQDRNRVVAELVKGNPISGMELRFRRKDGALITGLFSANTFAVGNETCILSSINDITERKRADEALRENEALLRTIAANYPNSYLSIIERDLTIGFTSGQEFKNQNLDPNQFVGLTLDQVFGDQTPTVREHYLKTFAGQEQSFELFINNQHELYRAVPLRAPDGTIPRILSVVENITERKRAQQEIEHLASFPRLNPNPVLEFDATGTITFASPAARELAAHSHVPVTAFLPRDLDAIAQALAQKRGDAFRREVAIGEHIFEENISLLPEMGVARIYAGDITARRQSEEFLRARVRLMEYSAIHSLGEILQKTLDEVGVIVNSPIGFYHFVEPDQKTLSLQAWSTRTLAEFCAARGEGLHYSVDEAGVWVDCVHQRQPVIHNDYASLPHRKGLPEGHAPV